MDEVVQLEGVEVSGVGGPELSLERPSRRLELRGLVGQIGAATFQVAAAGDNTQVARAKELLAQTRRGLYQILADDEPGDQPKD